jgi:hypothetical protein
MLPSVASCALYILRDHLKTFKSICQIYCNIFDIGKWVGYWLTGVRYFRIRIHCNTILSYTNTIVYSNIPSSQHSPFRNHFDESTIHSIFPKRFFQRLVERLANWILKLKWWIGCSLRSHRAHFIFCRNYLKTFKSICQIYCNIFDIGKWVGYSLTGVRYFRIRIHCILPTKHPTVVPLSGIVPIQFYIQIFLPLNIFHLGTSLGQFRREDVTK